MSHMHAQQFGQELCTALGLDGRLVKRIVIDASPKHATVEITEMVSPEIPYVVSHYRLVPIEGEA